MSTGSTLLSSVGGPSTARPGGFVEPSPSALLLLGQRRDLASERGVECVGDLPAPSDPDLVERARGGGGGGGGGAVVVGAPYPREEVID
ncbi:hypothetical protein [Cellulosimicrobium funkei]|uniref:hypothetical protein n=1 Tax=Cellulosimicrobium funkei TaxID=264251 RepID=UPI003756FA87